MAVCSGVSINVVAKGHVYVHVPCAYKNVLEHANCAIQRPAGWPLEQDYFEALIRVRNPL